MPAAPMSVESAEGYRKRPLEGEAAAAAAPAAPVMATGAMRVKADDVAKPFRAEIQKAVEQLPGGIGPKLVGLLANGDPAARQYAEWTARAFTADKLRFELRECDENAVEDELDKMNVDPDIHGIMIYYPCFGQRPSFHGGSHDDYLRDSVSCYKDVEGLNHYYRRCLYKNQRYVDGECKKKCVLPCTPLAVVKILEHLEMYDPTLPIGDRMAGKSVVVINRSEVVGRPLAAMLANDGALVYSVDIASIYVFQRGKLVVPEDGVTQESAVRNADVVILGVPSDNFKLDPSWVKEGAVVLNVSSNKNIDDKVLLATRPGVRYCPQVGKVTVAMLERNLLRLYQNFIEEVEAGKNGQPSI
eukprot:TRINITY_DN91134_c0_g1_i1.p1 TRINITY_DN91134_c0_g1~~TRINITY_DN91134_c0_g1_i1.p1  ORF type:complete len:358 (+),score=88.68 TRINITY_DN91134_c0_g1_i1:80-1153(+)